MRQTTPESTAEYPTKTAKTAKPRRAKRVRDNPLNAMAEPTARLSRDAKEAASSLGDAEIRFLVRTYYQIQENRIRSAAQLRELQEAGEPHLAISWLADQDHVQEAGIHHILDEFTSRNLFTSWMRKTPGIGPVISAGLMAYLDFSRPHAGHIFAFCGLAPGQKWEKGERRPWCAAMKTITYHIRECMIKVQNQPGGEFYGSIYRKRKRDEQNRNEAGKYAPIAKRLLSEKMWRTDTVAIQYLKKGMLPPGHIHSRAGRIIAKLFLSHVHTVGHFLQRGKLPAKPYAFDYLDHEDEVIMPPFADAFEGLPEALEAWRQ